MQVKFTILGEPKGKGRPRFSRKTGTAITPKDTVNYETLVKSLEQKLKENLAKDTIERMNIPEVLKRFNEMYLEQKTDN